MNEKGISLEGQRSKGLQDVAVTEMDVVVSMGHEVECPMPAGFKGCVVEWNIPIPIGRGIESFRNVRDMIERQVLELLAEHLAPDSPRISRGVRTEGVLHSVIRWLVAGVTRKGEAHRRHHRKVRREILSEGKHQGGGICERRASGQLRRGVVAAALRSAARSQVAAGARVVHSRVPGEII